MEIRIEEPARVIVSNPHGRHNYFGWPSVARLHDGRLALAASGYRCGHVCPFGKTVMAESRDEGKHWTGAWPVIDTPLDDRDGGIAAFGDAGVIVTSFNNSRAAQRGWNPLPADPADPDYRRAAYYHAYLDTVTPEEEARCLGASFRLSLDDGRTFGPILRSPVTSPHGPTALRDGTLLWVGRVFSADDGFSADSAVHAYTVAPDGTMAFLGAVPAVFRDGAPVYFCEPHVALLPDETLLCLMRTEGAVPFTLFETRSADGGRTWSLPRQVLPDRGGAPAHLLPLTDGTLVCAYGYREAPWGIRVMASRDGGESWSAPATLYTGVSPDLGYPCTVELRDGSLLTVFYAKEDPAGPAVIMQVRWRLSEGGGAE